MAKFDSSSETKPTFMSPYRYQSLVTIHYAKSIENWPLRRWAYIHERRSTKDKYKTATVYPLC